MLLSLVGLVNLLMFKAQGLVALVVEVTDPNSAAERNQAVHEAYPEI
jgi:hypothetical protein